jgi:hypothetical protein
VRVGSNAKSTRAPWPLIEYFNSSPLGFRSFGKRSNPGRRYPTASGRPPGQSRSRLGAAACSPVAVEAPQAGWLTVAVRSEARRHAVAWAW